MSESTTESADAPEQESSFLTLMGFLQKQEDVIISDWIEKNRGVIRQLALKDYAERTECYCKVAATLASSERTFNG